MSPVLNLLVRYAYRLLLVFMLTALAHAAINYYLLGFFWLKIMTVSYGLAYVLSVVSYLAMQHSRKKKSEHLGFLFMWRSMIKMILYFLIFALIIKGHSSGKIIDFIVIVLPYSAALIVEVVDVVSTLNKEV